MPARKRIRNNNGNVENDSGINASAIKRITISWKMIMIIFEISVAKTKTIFFTGIMKFRMYAGDVFSIITIVFPSIIARNITIRARSEGNA